MQVTSGRSHAGAAILVVETDVLVRMSVSEFLRSCGYRVVEAADAGEAILILERSGVAFGTVLGGAGLPRAEDGFALSRWIRANRPGVQVILAGNLARTVDAAAELCASGPTPRSNERDQVLQRIQRLLASRTVRFRARPDPTGAASGAQLPLRRRRVAGS